MRAQEFSLTVTMVLMMQLQILLGLLFFPLKMTVENNCSLGGPLRLTTLCILFSNSVIPLTMAALKLVTPWKHPKFMKHGLTTGTAQSFYQQAVKT